MLVIRQVDVNSGLADVRCRPGYVLSVQHSGRSGAGQAIETQERPDLAERSVDNLTGPAQPCEQCHTARRQRGPLHLTEHNARAHATFQDIIQNIDLVNKYSSAYCAV